MAAAWGLAVKYLLNECLGLFGFAGFLQYQYFSIARAQAFRVELEGATDAELSGVQLAIKHINNG